MPTHAELVTPERILYSGEAEFVVLRADGGEIMFLPNHADYVAAVDICVVRIANVAAEGEADAGEVRAAMAGGFVHVADNRVTVLASVAELADEIDVDRARRALEAAESAETETATPAMAASTPAGDAHGAGDAHEAEETPAGSTMLALLQPDLPAVRARRARARLEAAGVLEGSSGSAPAPAH
ncbi:MAG: ATP synthase F1 subunit epsilon [Acidimicrobiales bacterium]